MSQIKDIAVSIIALIIIYFFIRVANTIGAPNIFTIIAIVIVLMILWYFARVLVRGY